MEKLINKKELLSLYTLLKDTKDESLETIKQIINSLSKEKVEFIENLSEVDLYFYVDKYVSMLKEACEDKKEELSFTLDLLLDKAHEFDEDIANWYKTCNKFVNNLTPIEFHHIIMSRKSAKLVKLNISDTRKEELNGILSFNINKENIDFLKKYTKPIEKAKVKIKDRQIN